jgi:uncharacterized protein (DUF2252 family)
MDKKILRHFQSQQETVEERIARGKTLREKFPRINQGDYKPAANRADPVSILEEQATTRLPELVPIRYARMLVSPFAFLRGGAAIMAADLAAQGATSGINVQACGDMHVANFGVFASAERQLIFGINDFDETFPGPWEWDLKRLVTSIVASCRFLGGDEDLCAASVRAAVKSYRKRMKQFAVMGNMELWYYTINEKSILKTLTPLQQKAFKKMTNKARTRTHLQVLGKLTDIVDEKYRFRDDAPFIVHETHTQFCRTIEEGMEFVLGSYLPSLSPDRRFLLEHYRIVDVARKIVGVGSVGQRCWILFLKGNHDEDPLFLQFKEAQPSVLEQFLPGQQYKNNGERVVQGQRLIQGAPDIFMGWGEQDGIDFYVRQLRDMKGGPEFDPEKVQLENIPAYCKLCAWALALAHAKSSDAAVLAGYLGNSDELDEAMVRFAFAYADQNEKDYQLLVAASKSGRIKIGVAESVAQ